MISKDRSLRDHIATHESRAKSCDRFHDDSSQSIWQANVINEMAIAVNYY